MHRLRAVVSTIAMVAFLIGSGGKTGHAGEYQKSLKQIGVTRSVQKKLKYGRGVVVGVFDGLAAPHNDLIVDGLWTHSSGSYSFYSEHGSAVAGIIGAEKNHMGIVGVAPSAKIQSYGYFDDDGNTPTVLQDWVDYAYANQKIRVANMSFVPGGLKKPLALSEIDRHTIAEYRNRILFAVAAGNSGKKFDNHLCTFWTGDCNKSSKYMASLMIVGALNKNGTKIVNYSNRPGHACFTSHKSTCRKKNLLKYYFIVAPGSRIKSTSADGRSYVRASGTSFAAPHVAGAAALLMSRWKFLKRRPQTVARILFETADDLGKKGVDNVYGWGRLNLKSASKSHGKASIPTGKTVGGPSVALASSGMRLSPAFGDGVSSALSHRTMAYFDKYGRDFQFDAGETVVSRPISTDPLDILSSFDARSPAPLTKTSDTGHLAFYRPAPDALHKDDVASGFALGASIAGVQIAIGKDLMPSTFAPAAGLMPTGEAGRAANNGNDATHLDLIGPAAGVAVLKPDFASLGPVGRVGFGAAAFTRSHDPQDRLAAGDGAHGFLVTTEITPARGLRADLHMGQVYEDGAALGAEGDGYFSIDGATTTFVGANITAAVTKTVEVGLRYERGWAKFDGAYTNSLSSAGVVPTESFGATLVTRRLVTDDDRFGLSLSQPLRIAGGTLKARLPVGRTNGGEIRYQNVRTSAAPAARELRLGIDYARPVMNSAARIAVGVQQRFNPDHGAGGDSETIGMLRLTMRLN